MQLLRIPLSDTQPCYRQEMALSGTRYSVEMRFNTRMGRWMLSIFTLAQQPIVLGLPVVIDTNLTGQYVSLPVPAGAFIAVDNTGNQQQPGLGSFVTSHWLIYVDPTL